MSAWFFTAWSYARCAESTWSCAFAMSDAVGPAFASTSACFASASWFFAVCRLRALDCAVCDALVLALATATRADRTAFFADAICASVAPASSVLSFACAAVSDAASSASWSLASAASAVARTSPCFTFWPTETATDSTGQVSAVEPDPAAAEEDELASAGSTPNARSYSACGAMDPDPTTSLVTFVTVAWPVRYWVGREPKLGPTMTKAIAPIPTAISAIAATIRSFMGARSWAEQRAPPG